MTAREITPPPWWGIGAVGSTPWPVSADDIATDTESAVEHLRILGVPEGGLVLIVSRLAETIHVAPLELAAGRIGARWSSADATAGDAFRAASLVRQLSPDAVVGVNAAVVDALADPAAAFRSVPSVAVTDDTAFDALDNPRRWMRLGPTSAFECGERAGAHYDAARWRIENEDGTLLVTNLVPRATPADRFPTGVRGRIIDEPCRCGHAWPRVTPL